MVTSVGREKWMIIIKVLLTVIVFALPLIVGIGIRRDSMVEAYLFGQVAIWAVFQLIAVPMVLLHLPFTALFITFVLVLIALSIVGVLRFKRGDVKLKYKKEDINLWLIPAILVIAFQAGMYFFGQRLNEDDARWIAEACDAIEKNTMLLHNPATGEYLGSFQGEMVKDVFSPWSMYIAVLSKMTFLRPATIAHTVYAPILLILAYLVYYLIGTRLFKEKFEQGAFLLMVSVIFLFFSGNRYTQAMFSLTRIWQGKATVAAIFIPLVLLAYLIITEDTINNWLLLIISSAAGCLFSGMGIAFSLVLVGGYGIYALILKRFKGICYFIIAISFPLIYGLLNYLIFKV